MSTVIYPSPVFGPVHSRRLGVSLGINLMPSDGKICTFDCIYCECGRNADRRPSQPRPTRQQVRQQLYMRLEDMKLNGTEPNVITFAGNGEPTAHPEFAGIVDDVIELRNLFFPEAKVCVLSNATRVTVPDVFNALLKLDRNIQKLDTVNPEYISLIDNPVGSYDLERTIGALASFKGHVIIQTMFLCGTLDGRDMDNTGDEYVLPWIETLKRIAPEQVLIYTVDRETPVSTLSKASHEALDRIVGLLKQNGFNAQASY